MPAASISRARPRISAMCVLQIGQSTNRRSCRWTRRLGSGNMIDSPVTDSRVVAGTVSPGLNFMSFHSLVLLRRDLADHLGHRLQDLAWLSPGGVVGVHIDPSDDAVRVGDDDGRHGQSGGPVRVDLGQVQAQLQLGSAGAVAGRRQDAELPGDLVARIGQDGEGQLLRLLRGQGSVWRLRADGDQADAPLGQRGNQLRLVGAEGDVAVGAPGAAVEHDDGGLAAQVLGERGRLAADVEQFRVRQLAAGPCHAGRVAGCGQVALLGRRCLGGGGGQLAGRGPVLAGYLLGGRSYGAHRILGSAVDAEDAFQESLTAAGKGRAGFEGRASFRTWLYRIATGRCLNMVRASRRSPVSVTLMDVEPPEPSRLGEVLWLEPYPDAILAEVADPAAGPEARYEQRETISLAFITALQLLPPRQRAALILTDVLDFSGREVADMLDTTEHAIYGAVKRARATLARQLPKAEPPPLPNSLDEKKVLDRLVRAWEECDTNALVAMLTEEV